MRNKVIGLIIGLCLIFSSKAAVIEFDPGPEGSSFFYSYHNFRGVFGGTPMIGQDLMLDFLFSENKSLVAEKIDIDISIPQANLGVWPEHYFTVKGFLFDSVGHKVTDLVYFENTSVAPGFIVPEDGTLFPEDAYYLLPDGKTKYVPASTGYSAFFDGPLAFSGIHFDITAPLSPLDTILGVSLVYGNYRDYNEVTNQFENPIYISQNQLPNHSVPEPSAMLLTSTGLLIIALAKKRPRTNK